jgi:SAM-dependent methyltransferase
MNDPRPQVAGVFDRSAPTYDSVGVTFFADVGDRLVDVASLQPGERVVDMGCGRGAALFPAATAVGPTGSVHGLDIAATMVDLTRGEILLRGLTNVTVEVGDAQQPDLPRRDYDVVLSSLAVFFLPDPGAGLRAWLEEVLPSRNPSATSPGATKDAPGPFQTAELLHELLSTSGWVGGSSTEVEHTLRFADPDQWVRWSWSHGMRTYWERLDDDGRLAAEDRARAELRRMESEPQGLTLRMRLRYTTASAAG